MMSVWKVLGSIVLTASLAAGCGEDAMPAGTDAGLDGGTQSSTVAMGTKAFLESCTTNEECQTNLCYLFNMASVGKVCTKTCSGPADCPAPSTGCNGMGVCKRN